MSIHADPTDGRRDGGRGGAAGPGWTGGGSSGERLALVEAELGTVGPQRAARLLRWLFTHRADLLAALVYGCLAFLSFSALAEYANGHHLFPEPEGGWAFAVAIDGAVLYAFISFRRAPWLASLLLMAGASASFVLQQWHAADDQHPAVVAGVVPAAMVLVTFAWHRIRSWMPAPEVPPFPDPAPEEATPPAPPGPDQLDPDRPERVRLYAQVWLAQKRAVAAGATEVDFSVEDWQEVLRAYSDGCGYCGAEGVPLSIEHRTPLSRGGRHVTPNIVPACAPCNLSKGTKTDEEWMAHREVVAKATENGTKIHRNGWTKKPSAGRTPLDRDDVARRVATNQSARSMAIDMGLSQRRYREELLPLVRDIKRELTPSQNGHSPGADQ